MKDVRSIMMYMNTFNIFTIDITPHMCPTINHDTRLACLTSSPCEGGTKEACTNYQIIVFLHKLL